MASNRKLNNALPASLTKALGLNNQKLPVKKSYELQAVISFVRGKTRTHDDYHVVHVKAPRSLAKQTLLRQLQKIDECILEKERCDKEQQMSVVAGITLEAMNQITLVTDIALESLTARKEQVLKKLASLEDQSEEDWLLINGLKVTRTTSDDARSFCGSLKEPSIIIFREVENQNEVEVVKESLVPVDVMDTVSYSNGSGPLCSSTEGKSSSPHVSLSVCLKCLTDLYIIKPCPRKEIWLRLTASLFASKQRNLISLHQEPKT